MNYFIKLNLLKLKGAAVVNITGKTATKKCLVIPIDDSGLFPGEKGIYADITAWEKREIRGKDTHLLRQNFPREMYDTMTEEERNAMPILGSVRPVAPKEPPATEDIDTGNIDLDDLPF